MNAKAVAFVIVALISALCSARAQTQPPTDQPRPVAVAVAARILDVSRIQENIGEMAGSIELTLRWSDSRAAFDPVREGRVQKQFSGRAATQELERIWHPAATIRNLVGAPRSDELGLLIRFGGELTLVRTLEGTFRFPIDMTRFPFDDIRLPVELTSSLYASRDVVFTHLARDNAITTFNKTPRAATWRLYDIIFEQKSYIAWNGEERSLLSIEAEAARYGGQILIRIFVPFFMIMMSSLFVLWLPDTNYFGKGTMIFSSVIALVAFTFTLESNFPGSVSTQTPVSTILTTGFIYLVAALMLNILVMNPEAAWARRSPTVATEVRSIIKWAVPLVVLIIWGSLILRAKL